MCASGMRGEVGGCVCVVTAIELRGHLIMQQETPLKFDWDIWIELATAAMAAEFFVDWFGNSLLGSNWKENHVANVFAAFASDTFIVACIIYECPVQSVTALV